MDGFCLAVKLEQGGTATNAMGLPGLVSFLLQVLIFISTSGKHTLQLFLCYIGFKLNSTQWFWAQFGPIKI